MTSESAQTNKSLDASHMMGVAGDETTLQAFSLFLESLIITNCKQKEKLSYNQKVKMNVYTVFLIYVTTGY